MLYPSKMLNYSPSYWWHINRVIWTLGLFVCSGLHCSVLLNSVCAHRSDRPLGICEDHIQWLLLGWQWYHRTVVISGLRDLWVLLALCLRGSGSRGAGGHAHFTFSSAHCLLQRLCERFRVTRIFPSLLIKNLVKTLLFNYQSFCDQEDWIILKSCKCGAIGFLKPSNRERNWILVCAQKPQRKY